MARRSKSTSVASAASGTALEPLDAEITQPGATSESDPLTFKQRLFVEAYIGRARGNATEAARLAGYEGDDGSLATMGWENLRKPEIHREVARRRKELVAAISPERLILSALEEAEASVEDFITVNPDGTFSVDLAKAQQNKKLHLLDGVEHDRETGAPVIKMPNKKAAREFLAKMLGYGAKDPAHQVIAPVQVQIYQHMQALPTEEIKKLTEPGE